MSNDYSLMDCRPFIFIVHFIFEMPGIIPKFQIDDVQYFK